MTGVLRFVLDIRHGRKRLDRRSQMSFIRKLWLNRRGQDLIEYALLAGFVAVSAGLIMPGVAGSMNRVLSKVASVVDEASETGR
jgi:pilus assembly protein Flp/PilA